MQCDVIQVTFVYQTKSKILTYRKEYKVLENKLYYDFKLTLQFNHKKNCRIGTLSLYQLRYAEIIIGVPVRYD
jgi:hypothetical protein